ncbi:hypothetical protein [Gracilibacillus boraciitolerans]|uniref:hypothetical protein n=1 Tax=Gracilibacillus boraciitolerans TaxID=307521 RepID=UPI001F27512B|nr:hypothetical protein [Gracilibacillus boraciitolerans]
MANGFTVFVFACIVSLLSTIGFMLLVLPGLIILALLFPIPYITIFDDKSVWKSFKEGLRLGKKYYWKLALLIGLAGGMELIFGIVITVQLFNVTDSFMAQVITQIALNIIIYPFIVILITCYILKWRESLHTFDLAK